MSDVTGGVILKYRIIRTDTADAGIRKIVLYISENFGKEMV